MNRRLPILCCILLSFASNSAAQTEIQSLDEWRQTATLSAPEAIQAAAADEAHVYAIANRQIAKYDRQTGRRLAVSTGPAEHLNSGFFWQGKLYAAHSNYPRTPERSELKILDPATMELTTFKDFGNYGGSLTWAVREGEHWWCNFAHYGANNNETFLVKFDDQWRELGRWTYPPEVIRQLGRYSLSGGLWRDGSLLASGHDDSLLFRLEFEEGNVLRLVGTERVPFTGQGFAADPKTGGLVGINRGKRQIVFAEPATEQPTPRGDKPLRLRVLTYNIHHGEGVDGKLDLARIAKVIQSVEPHLVALQEVDQATERTGRVDQAAELARLTEMRVVFGGNFKFQGGEYGNAVLSRLPVKSHDNHLLPSVDAGEQRGVLAAELTVPGGGDLLFLATHLDHRRDDAERLASAKAINDLVAKAAKRPAILAGDLNATPESAVLQRFLTAWTNTTVKPLPTIPVAKPARQIDYVLVRPTARWKTIETRVLDEAVASDHRPLLTVLELLQAR